MDVSTKPSPATLRRSEHGDTLSAADHLCRDERQAALAAEQARRDVELVALVTYHNTRSGARIFIDSRDTSGLVSYTSEDGGAMMFAHDAQQAIERWRQAGELLSEVATITGREYREIRSRQPA